MKKVKLFLFVMLAMIVTPGFTNSPNDMFIPSNNTSNVPTNSVANTQSNVSVAITLNIPTGYDSYFKYPCVGYLYSQYEEKTYVEYTPSGLLAGSTGVPVGTQFSVYMSGSSTINSWTGQCLAPYSLTIKGGDYFITYPFDRIQYASDPLTGQLTYYALITLPYDSTSTNFIVTINYQLKN